MVARTSAIARLGVLRMTISCDCGRGRRVRTVMNLETRLAEALMGALFPCDLGDGIEVLHDVELVEIEMDCDLGDDAWLSAPYEKIEILFEATAVAPPFQAELAMPDLGAFERSPVCDTMPFAPFEPAIVMTETVPYPRIDPETMPFVRPD